MILKRDLVPAIRLYRGTDPLIYWKLGASRTVVLGSISAAEILITDPNLDLSRK